MSDRRVFPFAPSSRQRGRILGILGLLCLAAAPATRPTTAPADAVLEARLKEIDSRAGEIKSLSAKFEQQKFTALLRKPLVSSGQIRINGSTIRWDTQKPEPTVLLIDPQEVKVFYPAQKTLEVYPIDKRLAELAASPLPRLAVLKEKFSFAQIPVSQLDATVKKRDYLALRLVPTDPSLAEHVKQVRVLLDIPHAFILKAEVTDGDGDKTELSFSDVRLNADNGDLSLSVPTGTVVTHPLEGLDGQDPRPQGASK